MTPGNHMEAVIATQKKYCKRALSLAIAVGFVLILLGFKSYGKGLILGSLFSILNFIIMGQVIPIMISPKKARSTIFSFLSILLRYALLAIPIYMAFRYPAFHIVTVIVGLFSIQIVILMDHLGSAFKTSRT